MSEAPDDHPPARAGTAWFWLNVTVLAVVVVWAVSLPLGVFHTAINQGTPLPRDFANSLIAGTWLLVGPLALLNLIWLLYAVRRRHEPPTLPEPPPHQPEQPAEPQRRGCSVGVVLLSVATCGLLCCGTTPHALWFEWGMWYAAKQFGTGGTQSGRFLTWITFFVWFAVGLLLVCNLVWLVYALLYWRTRELPPDSPVAVISEGATDHFPKQPPSPHVKPGDGIHEGP